MWDALKSAGIGAQRRISVRDVRTRYRVDFGIPCRRGNVAVIFSDAPRKLPKTRLGRAVRFTTNEIEQDAQACAHQVIRLTRELGGIKYTAE